MNYIQKLKVQGREYGVPIWMLPDMLIVMMGVINIGSMLTTYFLANYLAEDPQRIIIMVVVEAALIFVIGNILVESSRRTLEVNRLKREFAQTISHQMRTPLTTMKWYVDMIRDNSAGCLPPKQAKLFDSIQEENERMHTMIEEMLSVARIDAQNGYFGIEKFDAVALTKKIMEGLAGYARIRQVQMNFHCDYKVLEVNTNRDNFKVIVINLIENALRYTKPNKKVDIYLTQEENIVKFRVKDQGVGINKEDQKHLFVQFYRGRGAKQLEAEGTGLGLYITKQIVEKMNGKIDYETRVGKGTEFWVEIPA